MKSKESVDSYRGNKNLRKAGVQQEWTKEEIVEYARCSSDPIYFIKKYIKIVSLDDGVIPFELWDFQERLIDDIHNNRFVIGMWPRQSGKSTTIASYMLHYILFNANKTCAILANKASGAREILSRVQMAYELLPYWLKMGVDDDWNKGSMSLENGSRIVAAATSSSAIRGMTVNFVLLDEFAFVPFNMAEDFFRSVYPTISSGKSSKIIIISTPYGMNHFYKIWNEAKNDKNGYVPNRAFWNDVPNRDEEWKKETIRNIGEEAFNQEFDCEFMGSAGTLIDGAKLSVMTYQTPIKENNDGLRMYFEPEEDHSYIMTVDTSEGLDQDYHALSIFDISVTPYQQVLTFRSNSLNYLLLPDLIHSLGTKYNEAYVLLELNSMGNEVANLLYMDLEYENIMMVTMTGGRAGQVLGDGHKGRTQFGLKTTAQSKRVSCALLKTLIETDQLIVNDFNTYQEFTTFVRNKNSYEAEEGHNDDLVTTCRLFAWIIGQEYFKEEMEKDIRMNISRNQLSSIDDMMMPFGVYDDGIEDDIHDRVAYHLESWNIRFH
jgi:hypothetical protein